MFPTERQTAALTALLKMERNLLAALQLGMQFCSPRLPSSPFTLEFFLCGLYLRIPKRALDYFDAKEPYQRMVEELCGEKPGLVRLKNTLDLLTRRDALSASVRLDDPLVEVLCQAADISSAGTRSRITIEDFMRALALKQDVVEKLSKERGLKLKAT